VQYGSPKGAEYTVGRVLVDMNSPFTMSLVRKRGLVWSWKGASVADEVRGAAAFQGQYGGPQGRVHRRSSPRRYELPVYDEPGAEERTRTSTSVTSPVVKNRARDLLRVMANGGDVSIVRVQDWRER